MCITWGKIPVWIPKKKVGFKNKSQQERGKNLWSKGDGCEEVNQAKSQPMWSSLLLSLCWMLTGEGDPMSVKQSCRVLSVSPHGCFRALCVLRHCTSISSAALCEENTRCCMWSLVLAAWCHGNTNQTAACTSVAQAGSEREQGGNEWIGGSTQASCQSKTVIQFFQAWRCERVL